MSALGNTIKKIKREPTGWGKISSDDLPEKVSRTLKTHDECLNLFRQL